MTGVGAGNLVTTLIAGSRYGLLGRRWSAAWLADADVWTTDRDFAGTGVASWSTPNLMRALAESDSPDA